MDLRRGLGVELRDIGEEELAALDELWRGAAPVTDMVQRLAVRAGGGRGQARGGLARLQLVQVHAALRCVLRRTFRRALTRAPAAPPTAWRAPQPDMAPRVDALFRERLNSLVRDVDLRAPRPQDALDELR